MRTEAPSGPGRLRAIGSAGLTVLARLRSERSIRRALATTLAGGLGVQLTLLATGVLLARALGPENRGYMALLTLVSAIAWQLGGLGIPLGLTFATARVPGAARRIVASLRNAIRVQAGLAVLGAAAALALLTAGKPGYVQFGAAMTVLAIAPAVYQRCGLGVLQGLRRFRSFNLWRIAPNALFAAVAAGLLVTGTTSFVAYAAAWAVSRSAFAVVTQRAARQAASEAETGEGGAPEPRSILKFGRRALFGGSPPIENFRIDQSVVALFLAPSALGFYVTALAFTNLPRFIAQSFALVSTPIVARQASHRKAKRSMWIFFWASMPFYLAVSIPLWIAAPELARFFFGPDFAAAGDISRILLVATVLFCARRVLADSSRGAGFPGIGSVAELTALISVVPLLAVCVPTWGVDGVGYALVASSTIALAVLVGGLLRADRKAVPAAWSEIQERRAGRPSSPVGELAA